MVKPIKRRMFAGKLNKVANNIKIRFPAKDTGDVCFEATCKVHFAVCENFLWKIDTRKRRPADAGPRIAIKTETLRLWFFTSFNFNKRGPFDKANAMCSFLLCVHQPTCQTLIFPGHNVVRSLSAARESIFTLSTFWWVPKVARPMTKAVKNSE